MKLLLFIIILFLLVTVFNLYSYENYDNRFEKVGNIGNQLCEYYCDYVKAILQKKDFTSQSENEFIKLFPKTLPFNQEIYNKLKEKNIQYETYKDFPSDSFWYNRTNERVIIHDIMKPYMHQIFNKAFIDHNLQKKVDDPIIHFRCADTPFIRNNDYTFQKYSYFKKALNELKEKIHFDKVVILSCSTHLSSKENQESCKQYSILLKNELKDYNVEIECGGIVDDFIKMFYAPAVVSTISSFSFMAGFFGKGVFIVPAAVNFDKEELDEITSEYKGFHIQHDKVKDYHNIDEVYKLLSET